MLVKSVELAGVLGAVQTPISISSCEVDEVRLTSSTVQVGKAEDVGGTADGAVAALAKSSLTFNECWDGRCHGGGGASKDDDNRGEMHFV